MLFYPGFLLFYLLLSLPFHRTAQSFILHGEERKVLFAIQEFCPLSQGEKFTHQRRLMEEFAPLDVVFAQYSDVCESSLGSNFFENISDPNTVAIVASLRQDLKKAVEDKTKKKGKIFVSWNEEDASANLADFPEALVVLLNYFSWKKVFIITTERKSYLKYAAALESRLDDGDDRDAIGENSLVVIPSEAEEDFLKRRLSRISRSLRSSYPGNYAIVTFVPYEILYEKMLDIFNEMSVPILVCEIDNIDFENGDDLSSNSTNLVLFFKKEKFDLKKNSTLTENFAKIISHGEMKVISGNFYSLREASTGEILFEYKSESGYKVWPSVPGGPLEWYEAKISANTNNNKGEFRCLDCEEDVIGTEAIAAIGITCVIIGIFLVAAVCLIRKQYVARKMMKDPCKILLTSDDIIFPNRVEPKRQVEDGLEVMLCCWMQQFQEFGTPQSVLKKQDESNGGGGGGGVGGGSVLMRHRNSCVSVSKTLPVSEIKAKYNGDMVQMKDIPVHGNTFELRSKALDVLIAIHNLRHENLNPLIGLLADPAKPALVWEYCSRGSLEDVLIQDEIKLDWSFRLSLLTDLVRGMKYLHSYRTHGALTSRNCVIDARWVLKITDYGLIDLNCAQNIVPAKKCARDLLWYAPELLRNEELMKKGTYTADVYSFAIIMQEVVVRGEPFCMLNSTPEEIVEKLKRPPPLIRPSVSKGAAPPEAINIMRQCWAEQPEMRPDFNDIYDLFKTLNHGRKINFVDTMFEMLEKYSNNLEDLIRDRTEQLDNERKKTEQLLNRMLPSSVAEKLKVGMPVDPEEFEEVTIYFSDIVGFTTISAYSTPFEIVNMLNDLYTCFDATINAYNVYKVETIGDAYMVVGGLPTRFSDHAEEIATMALDLLHQSGKFKIKHLPRTPLRLRIGLHTGPCCAGVVGLTMPRYCLFGDTVNTASRLESTGSPGRIHVSEATKCKLEAAVGKFYLDYRGETELRGKGKMRTYWLLGKEGFAKEIPLPPPLTGDNHGLDEDTIRMSREEAKSDSRVSPIHLPAQKSLDSGMLAAEANSRRKSTPRQMTTEGASEENEMSDIVGISFLNNKMTYTNSTKSRKYAQEDDLSTPYNYYRCLPPSEHGTPRKFASKFLPRQYSVDRTSAEEREQDACEKLEGNFTDI